MTEKAGFLSPIRSKITVTKEKERRKRNSEEKERRRREKRNGCTLIMATWALWPKKLLDGKGTFGGNVFKTPATYFVGVFVADRGISFALRAQVILL